MTRRTVVSALWFAWVYVAGEVVWSIAATPRLLNVLLALSVATFVFADPFRLFHPVGQERPSSVAVPRSAEAFVAR